MFAFAWGGKHSLHNKGVQFHGVCIGLFFPFFFMVTERSDLGPRERIQEYFLSYFAERASVEWPVFIVGSQKR